MVCLSWISTPDRKVRRSLVSLAFARLASVRVRAAESTTSFDRIRQ